MSSREGILERNEPGLGWIKRFFRLKEKSLFVYEESGNTELEYFPLDKDLYPQVFCRDPKAEKKFVFGIITKKDGKTKVLEANANTDEERNNWVKDIKAVFKDELTPVKEFGRTKKPEDGDENIKPEKDCQCVLM